MRSGRVKAPVCAAGVFGGAGMWRSTCHGRYTRMQGHECGAVVVRPLAVAAVLHAAACLSATRGRLLGRCGAAVTCLLAAAWEGVPGALLAGGEDGAVAAWRLRPLGEPLFRLPLHAGPV